MSKAKERALKAYPIVISQHSDNCKEYDSNESDRLTFIEGYHQAEKDLELGWEDIKTIDKLLNQCVDYNNPYQEVLKQFLKEREENDTK